MEEVNRIKGDAIKAGALQSNRVVVAAIKAADDVHKEAMDQAHTILLDFIERMERPPTEIVGWARPLLENLNNSVLGVVPPNGFPQDHQRLTHQYRAVFKQRLDIMLRNVEIGHQKGAGFARAEKVESKEEWISAAATLDLLKPTMPPLTATQAICSRAHDGVVRARAETYVWGNQSAERFNIPKEFWWARGEAALDQNWKTGDFETWIDQKIHLKAYGVSFLRADIEKMIPADASAAQAATSPPGAANPERNKGGRPKRDFWEELWVEIARQLYVGDLKPKTQADIESAMHRWISDKGHKPASESTVRDRARMLWRVIEDEN